MYQAKNLNRVAAIAALALIGAVPAFAGSGGKVVSVPAAPSESCLTYDFFDVQYIYTAFDHLDDGHGAGANLSKSLFGNVYLTASGSWTSTGTDWSGDADLYGASAGLGYYIPLSDRFHLNVEAGGLYGGSDGLGDDDESWGFFAGPGFRYCLNPGLELFSNVYYNRFEDGFDQWNVNVGLIADITDTVAFKLAGLLNEDDQSVLVGLRFYY
ncbi:MAG: hypothetical protein JNK37_00775 [Verrucomicrobiales bacterium]|nr:hypothetical protein [Verrucomicrobiales bacterium]